MLRPVCFHHREGRESTRFHGLDFASLPAETDLWAFNLNLYAWLPGAGGSFSAGPVRQSVDTAFIDIVDASHSFPLGFMSRFDACYDRFGTRSFRSP